MVHIYAEFVVNFANKFLEEGMGFGVPDTVAYAPALKQVGRLMVSDAFLGNDDRLIGPTVNLGNFFYATTTAAPGRITTIDNDSSSKAHERGRSGKLNDQPQRKAFMIGQLADPAGQMYFVSKFLAKFRQSQAAHASVIDALDDRTPRIISDIRNGITHGLADITDVFTNNMKLIRSMSTLSDALGAGKMKVDESAGLLSDGVWSGVMERFDRRHRRSSPCRCVVHSHGRRT